MHLILITFLLDLYLVHGRLQFGYGMNYDLLVTAKNAKPTAQEEDCGHSPGRICTAAAVRPLDRLT